MPRRRNGCIHGSVGDSVRHNLDRSSAMARSFAALRGAVAVVALLAAPAFAARTYRIAPIDLGSGFTLTGTISATGIGALTQADIVNWNIKVVSQQDILYTPANTRNLSTGLFAANDQLLVPTSPGGGNDGGAMIFYGQTYFQARPADFTGAWVKGGEAVYTAVGASGFVPLNRPNKFNYVAAAAASPGSTTFNLTRKNFGNGIVMSGTVTTDAIAGPVTLTDWQILVRETQTWSFTPKNSSVIDAFNVSTDGRILSVAPLDADLNPGSLSFGGFGAGDFTGVMLGNFTYDPAGVVGLVTPFIFQTVSAPLDANGNFVVGRYGKVVAAQFAAAAVPEPQSWAMMVAGFVMLGGALRRRLAVTGPVAG
jgi:hypothetical protein